jgi:hypothetical protein
MVEASGKGFKFKVYFWDLDEFIGRGRYFCSY